MLLSFVVQKKTCVRRIFTREFALEYGEVRKDEFNTILMQRHARQAFKTQCMIIVQSSSSHPESDSEASSSYRKQHNKMSKIKAANTADRVFGLGFAFLGWFLLFLQTSAFEHTQANTEHIPLVWLWLLSLSSQVSVAVHLFEENEFECTYQTGRQPASSGSFRLAPLLLLLPPLSSRHLRQ